GFIRLHGLTDRGDCRLDLPDVDATKTAQLHTPAAGHLAYVGAGVRVTIGKESIVELPPGAYRGRLSGMLFESAKAFLLPSAMHGMRELKGFFDRYQDIKMLVTGHTDTVGSDAYNLLLSKDRAHVIATFLREQVDE